MNIADPLLGQQVDNFLIQQALGRGGMARVYKGIDLSLKRSVAIKVIEEGLRASSSYAQRFEREAQAVANLKHPYIVTVFQFGKHDSLYYLVMEYIDGADLDAIMQNYESAGELMPYADVIRILDAVASALDYAHHQGVIHRDIKPSNVMLERDGRPVLTDFGLALRVSEGTIGDTFGSPHYISPEQARSSANAVPQSDLYSLAVVAYELLTGVLPFDDPVPTALALQHIMAAVPSPLIFNRNLSRQVEQVLLKGLAKTPEERYQTGAEFISALRQAVEALKQNPVRVATVDLPPLPPGVQPQEPRRLSMQTALDKIGQEMALSQAKGQALTRHPKMSKPGGEVAVGQGRRGGWLPYLIATVGALGALAVVGILLTNVLGGSPNIPTAAALPTVTSTSPVTMTVLPSTVPSTVSSGTLAAAVPTTVKPTIAPPTSLPPTPTVPPTTVPASRTTAPTATSTIPPTAIPASATAVLAALPTIPPTIAPAVVSTSVPPTSTGAQVLAPTVAYPDGRLFVLIWDEKVLYVANKSDQRLPVGSMFFERILTNNQFTNRYAGGRWAAYYAYSEPNKCLILKTTGSFARLPRNDCPYGQNSEVNAFADEVFWTPAEGSTEFRVLWNKSEVGRCPITQQRCEIRFPPS